MKKTVVVLGLWLVGLAVAAERRLNVPLLDTRPYGWSDAQGQAQGLYPDIIAALARETGLVMEVKIVPFARAASLVAGGEADVTLMFANSFTQGRAVEVAVVFYTDQVVQLRPELAPATRQALAQLKLARVNGGCLELSQVTDTPASGFPKFQDLATQESGVQMLLAKRVDGFCTVQESLTDAINRTGTQVVFQNAQRLVLASKPVFLMVSPALPQATVQRLTSALEQLRKTGELERIFRQRLGKDYKLRSTH